MNRPILDEQQRRAIATSIEATIRIGVIVVIVVACFALLRPFMIPVAWGAVIAVAFYPLFLKVRGWLGGRNALAATLLSVVLIAALLVPVVMLSETTIDEAGRVQESVESGELRRVHSRISSALSGSSVTPIPAKDNVAAATQVAWSIDLASLFINDASWSVE